MITPKQYSPAVDEPIVFALKAYFIDIRLFSNFFLMQEQIVKEHYAIALCAKKVKDFFNRPVSNRTSTI